MAQNFCAICEEVTVDNNKQEALSKSDTVSRLFLLCNTEKELKLRFFFEFMFRQKPFSCTTLNILIVFCIYVLTKTFLINILTAH